VKLTMIGTGTRAPGVLEGLARRQGELGLTEVVLHDVDHVRLETMSAIAAHLAREAGGEFPVEAERDARAAIAGADIVYAAIRVGQERARALDERVALDRGLLGQETTGPGGFAMAMRTIPVMLEYARLIADVAPEALLVNFTNPVGLIVQALCDHSSVRVVGICDGPPNIKRDVAAVLRVRPDDVHLDYLGLNHCGWARRALVRGVDRMPEVLARYRELQGTHHEWKLFDPELVRALGMLPMEYLYFYYYRERALANIARSGSTRGEQVAAIYDALWPTLHERVRADDVPGAVAALARAGDARSATYFARERGDAVLDEPTEHRHLDMAEGTGYEGLAAAVIVATAHGGKFPLILNVPNRGAIADLADDDVVEVTCLVDGHGAHPLAQGALPEQVRGLVTSVKAYERLTVRAAVTGSYETALQALLAHPLVGSFDRAKSVLDGYLAAHAEFLGYVAA
jgi:6-phospho-beta-glucosidase